MCTYIHIFIYVYMYIYVYIYIYVYVYIRVYVYVREEKYVHISIYVCIHICVFLFMCTYMYAYFYGCMSDAGMPAYTNVHTYIHTLMHINTSVYIHTNTYLCFAPTYICVCIVYPSMYWYVYILTHFLMGRFPEEYMKIARVHDPYTWGGGTALSYLYIILYIFTIIHRYTHLCVCMIHLHICVFV